MYGWTCETAKPSLRRTGREKSDAFAAIRPSAMGYASRPKEQPMARAAAIIALSERLRKQSHKARNREVIADLRLATCYLRALALLKIAEEVEVATNPAQKRQLEQEGKQLHTQ